MSWQTAASLAQLFSETALSDQQFYELIVSRGESGSGALSAELEALLRTRVREFSRPDELTRFAAAAAGALAVLRAALPQRSVKLLASPAAWIPNDLLGQVADLEHELVELVAAAKREVIFMAPFTTAESITTTVKPLAALRGDVRLLILAAGSEEFGRRFEEKLRVLLPLGLLGRLTMAYASESAGMWPHAKLMLVDGAHGYLGSANFTRGGLGVYFELGTLLDRRQCEILAQRIIPKLRAETFTRVRSLA